jgi:hypothetical protein
MRYVLHWTPLKVLPVSFKQPAALAGVSDAYLTGSACGASFLDRQDGKSPSLDWVPTLRDFREVFDAYGYTEEAAANDSDDFDEEGEAGTSGKEGGDPSRSLQISMIRVELRETLTDLLDIPSLSRSEMHACGFERCMFVLRVKLRTSARSPLV